MRYERPIVMDLGPRARTASGQAPQACFNGPAAGGTPCMSGTGGFGLGGYCGAGSSADACASGPSAVNNGCWAGPFSTVECVAGGSGSLDTCSSGPAAT